VGRTATTRSGLAGFLVRVRCFCGRHLLALYQHSHIWWRATLGRRAANAGPGLADGYVRGPLRVPGRDVATGFYGIALVCHVAGLLDAGRVAAQLAVQWVPMAEYRLWPDRRLVTRVGARGWCVRCVTGHRHDCRRSVDSGAR